MSDFPIRFRGYDRTAVDARLRELADKVEALRRAQGSPAEMLASAAGEQVRAVIAAAETSAAEIVAAAECDAAALRGTATREGRGHVEGVLATGGATLERLDALRGELAALLGALGAAGGQEAVRVASEPPFPGVPSPSPAEPDKLVPDPDAPEPAAEPEDPDRLVPDPDAPPAAEAPTGSAAAGRSTGVPVPAQAPAAAVADAPAVLRHEDDAPDAPDVFEDDEGARLVALDLALSGAPRADADRYLAEHFVLGDRAGLLDDVYAAAGV